MNDAAAILIPQFPSATASTTDRALTDRSTQLEARAGFAQPQALPKTEALAAGVSPPDERGGGFNRRKRKADSETIRRGRQQSCGRGGFGKVMMRIVAL
jgi:hypothetical protein